MWGTNPLLLQKSLSGEVPPYCVLPHSGWDFFCETVSLFLLPILMCGPFILCCGEQFI